MKPDLGPDRARRIPNSTGGEHMSVFVRFEHVKKVYQMGEVQIEALRDATFTVGKGELCVIVGPSGAGKTTLLNILGGMDTLTQGRIFLENEEISAYSSKQLTAYRRHDIGFVFQFYNLVKPALRHVVRRLNILLVSVLAAVCSFDFLLVLFFKTFNHHKQLRIFPADFLLLHRCCLCRLLCLLL